VEKKRDNLLEFWVPQVETYIGQRCWDFANRHSAPTFLMQSQQNLTHTGLSDDCGNTGSPKQFKWLSRGESELNNAELCFPLTPTGQRKRDTKPLCRKIVCTMVTILGKIMDSKAKASMLACSEMK
jgi:hypothetical protein